MVSDATSGMSAESRSALQNLQQALQDKRQELYQKSSYGSRITDLIGTADFYKDLNGFLSVVGAVLVIPQDALENRYFYGTKVEAEVERFIAETLLPTITFSNSFVQEIDQAYVDVFNGDRPKKSRSTKPTVTFDVKRNTQLTAKATTTAKGSPLAKAKTVRPKPIRTTTGRFYSVANLQALLDAQIVEAVKQNMGSGLS